VMDSRNVKDVESLSLVHERIRGYGHVKVANLFAVKRRERELAARLKIEAQTGGYVQASMDRVKGSIGLRGIPVVVVGK
jgi:indolepyruvate ferredoxin oxidoreductase